MDVEQGSDGSCLRKALGWCRCGFRLLFVPQQNAMSCDAPCLGLSMVGMVALMLVDSQKEASSKSSCRPNLASGGDSLVCGRQRSKLSELLTLNP